MSPKKSGKPMKSEKKSVAKQASSEKKKSAKAIDHAAPAVEVDPDEVEAQQEAEEIAAMSSSGGGAMAGLEAASKAGGTEVSVSLKNFRHHPDMENFYRFIFENDLRFEALEILDRLFHEKELKKLTKVAKAKAN